jgi:quercetin dioxygenase-like cupin family protein
MTDTTGRKGISIHRAADAPALEKTDFMTQDPSTPHPPPAVIERIGAGAAAGAQLKVLVRDAGGFSLVHIWFKPNFPLPRHTHNVDCMYYVISGCVVMGNVTLRAGDSFFIPAGAPYQYSAGPDGVEVLEIRHGAEQFDIKLTDIGEDRWQAMAEVVIANQEQWAEMPTSPTYAANAS